MNISTLSSEELLTLKSQIDIELAKKVDVYSITLRLNVRPTRMDDIGDGRNALEIADSIATSIADPYRMTGCEGCGVYEAKVI